MSHVFNSASEICDQIEKLFPDIYLKTTDLPSAFKGSDKIKAIVLGADPSFISGKADFNFVFKLEDENSPFFHPILNNLKEITLDLKDIYVQNLVRNYFKVETTKNKHWLKCAVVWVDYLKKELDSFFPSKIPVFITAWKILIALTDKSIIKNLSPQQIYKECIFILPNENRLGRTLIPIFRHPKYQLKKWSTYKGVIIKKLSN